MSGAYRSADATVSAYRAAVVTPSDSDDIECTRGLYVGTSGDVNVTFADGGTLVLPGLAAGVVHPLQVTRVWATDTTASGIRALY